VMNTKQTTGQTTLLNPLHNMMTTNIRPHTQIHYAIWWQQTSDHTPKFRTRRTNTLHTSTHNSLLVTVFWHSTFPLGFPPDSSSAVQDETRAIRQHAEHRTSHSGRRTDWTPF
jgi:hypothetical protein